jgi:hypothetical protein
MSKNIVDIDHHLLCFFLFTETGFFLFARLYSVLHIDGERTRGDMIEKGKGIGHECGGLRTLVDLCDVGVYYIWSTSFDSQVMCM